MSCAQSNWAITNLFLDRLQTFVLHPTHSGDINRPIQFIFYIVNKKNKKNHKLVPKKIKFQIVYSTYA